MAAELTGTFLTLDDGRPAVRFVREYDHPVDRVWRFVTDADELVHWFPSRAEIDLRPGGAVVFSGDPALEDSTGRVVAVDPPRHLSFTWEEDEIHFDLEELGSAPASPSPTCWAPRTPPPATAPAGTCASPRWTRGRAASASRAARRPGRARPGAVRGLRRGRGALRGAVPGRGRLTAGRSGQLPPHQLVQPPPRVGEQLSGGALLDHLAGLHHHHPVRVQHRRQTVGDDDAGRPQRLGPR
ncbi:hypothetical protein SALBM217S_00587 [Streptomyces griseoloalbus]